MPRKIAIIGAGLAGLIAARTLADAGRSVTVFDKSRGLGGRLATRRGDGFALDHGAPYLTAYTSQFRQLLDQLCRAQAAAHWPRRGHVGLPGMSGLVRPLAEGLNIEPRAEIASLTDADGQVMLTDTQGADYGPFSSVISAIPAPQARRFTAALAAEDAALAAVEMTPVWALLLALGGRIEAADEIWPGAPNAPTGPLGLILRNSAKPGRPPTPDTWIAHATPDWSRANLDRSADTVAGDLVRAFEAETKAALPPVLYASAHRWRYGSVKTPLGRPFLEAFGGRLLFGGDWALGPRAEDAFASGQAMARALLR